MTKVNRSTYQKVVEENKRLLADIRVLSSSEVLAPEKILCAAKWQKAFEKEKEFNGLMKAAATRYILDHADELPEFLTAAAKREQPDLKTEPCAGNCGMNYCDDNGCTERKRVLVEPCDAPADLPAPNTVMWWLCRIADDEIRRKAVGNCLEQHESGHMNTMSVLESTVRESVWMAFTWAITEEEEPFWSGVYNSKIPLLPEPDFTEYNNLRK